jgi:ankyrin repeat protein
MIEYVPQDDLHNAAKNGDEAKVAVLLSREDVGDLIRKRDNHERTPLHLACFNNHANVVNQLLAAGI